MSAIAIAAAQRHARTLALAAGLITGLVGAARAAEVTDATCDVYPRGAEQPSASIGCAIRQDMGFVTIRREDGVVHDLRPAGDKPGLYMDQNGGSAYGLPLEDTQGFLFRFTHESVEIRWDDADLQP